MYIISGMHSREGMSCGVVEVVNHSTLKYFRYLEIIGDNEMTRRIYIDTGNVRGQLHIKWEE